MLISAHHQGQPRNQLKKGLISRASDAGSSDADAGDPDRYELCFTATELKACVKLVDNIPFEGRRFKNESDRLYGLFRHKVLGKNPIKLERAIAQLREKIAARERLEREAREEREEAAREAEARAQEEAERMADEAANAQARTRQRLHPDDRDESGSDVSSLFGERLEADRQLLASGPVNDDSDDSVFDMPTTNTGTSASSPPEAVPRLSPSARERTNVCFRKQTAHDRRKMQPAVSKDERIAQLQQELGMVRRNEARLKRKNALYKVTYADAIVLKQQAEEQQNETRLEFAEREAELAAVKEDLRQKYENLKQAEQKLAIFNSKVSRDFW